MRHLHRLRYSVPFVLAGLLIAAAPQASTSGAYNAMPAGTQVKADAGIASAPAPVSAPVLTLPGAASLERNLPWKLLSRDRAWSALLRAPVRDEQTARWFYALSLLSEGLGAETLGVLDLMRRQDAGLDDVANYRLARGQALMHLGRYADAAAALDLPALAHKDEACAWRMRAKAQMQQYAAALTELRCALPALRGRNLDARTPFILDLAQAAIGDGQQAFALDWLRLLPEENVRANLLRGEAQLRLGHVRVGETLLAQAETAGDQSVRATVELLRIEDGVRRKALGQAEALKRLDQLAFIWRGDSLERRAQLMRYTLARAGHDLPSALASGATLLRHADIQSLPSNFIRDYQSLLGTTLDPANGLPVDRAAGLYWDYRDLAPTGAEGDFLASKLAARLEEAGLYDRAAGAEAVKVENITTDKTAFPRVYRPGSPAADAQGYVQLPNVNSLVEAADMKAAQRSYEANLNAIEAAKNLTMRTIDLLK